MLKQRYCCGVWRSCRICHNPPMVFSYADGAIMFICDIRIWKIMTVCVELIKETFIFASIARLANWCFEVSA